MSSALTLDEIWRRICAQEREFFQTHQGQWFSYRIEEDCVFPSHSDLRIARADFERIIPMLPLADPRKIAKYVTDFRYVAAIVSDPRIAKDDW